MFLKKNCKYMYNIQSMFQNKFLFTLTKFHYLQRNKKFLLHPIITNTEYMILKMITVTWMNKISHNN